MISYSIPLLTGLLQNIGKDRCVLYRKPFQVSHLKLEVCQFPSIQDVFMYSNYQDVLQNYYFITWMIVQLPPTLQHLNAIKSNLKPTLKRGLHLLVR